ncbi:hypothetical protein JHK85_047728 [Glycine max]|nr:hypothetical protein JHK85_047728 [Glycine max]
MEDRKANTISVISVIALIILIIVARVSLKLSRAFFLICGASIAVILAVFSCALIRHRYNHRRRLLESQLKTEGRELRIEYSFLRKVAGVPTKYRFKELEEATDDPADHRNLARLLTSVSSHVDCTSTYSLGTTNTILSGR